MLHNIPEALRVIVEQLQRFPGLGPKSALRCAMHLLDISESDTKKLGNNIHALRDVLFKCVHCGVLADTAVCSICNDPSREERLLCIVSEWDSFLTIENAGFYKGYYLVLTPNPTPSTGIYVDPHDIQRLHTKLQKNTVTEIIFGLGTTLEAENIATYFSNLIKETYKDISISRLAQGIPLGAEVKFMDKETLRQSMKYRQNIE